MGKMNIYIYIMGDINGRLSPIYQWRYYGDNLPRVINGTSTNSQHHYNWGAISYHGLLLMMQSQDPTNSVQAHPALIYSEHDYPLVI